MTATDIRGTGGSTDPYYFIVCDADSSVLDTQQTKYIQLGCEVNIYKVDTEDIYSYITSVTSGKGLSIDPDTGKLDGTISNYTGNASQDTIRIGVHYEDSEGTNTDYTFTLQIVNLTRTATVTAGTGGKLKRKGSGTAQTSFTATVPYGCSWQRTLLHNYQVGFYLPGHITSEDWYEAVANTGYSFNAWSPSTGGPITSNGSSVQATFTAATYTITFNRSSSFAGNLSNYSTTTTYGSTASSSVTSTMSGYRFVGWYQGSTFISSSTTLTVTVTGNATYTATWEKVNDVSFSITPSGGGKVNNSTSTTIYNVPEGTSYSISNNVLTISGYGSVTASPSTYYVFTKWTDGNGNDISSSGSITSSFKTFKAVFTEQVYSYRLYYSKVNTNATNEPDPQNVLLVHESSHPFTITYSVPLLEGYACIGWSTTRYSTGTGTPEYTGGDTIYISGVVGTTAEVTLYAVYSQQRQISLDVNTVGSIQGTGGTVSGTSPYYVPNNTPWSINGNLLYLNNSLYSTASANPGYTFTHWRKNDTQSSSGYVTEALNTFTATFTANTYQVTLNPNGGALPSGTSDQMTVTFNDTYGVLPTPTRTGYTFLGWYTQQTGGTKVEGSNVVSIPSDHTLYAHWDAPVVTISLTSQTPNQSVTVSESSLIVPLNTTWSLSRASSGATLTFTITATTPSQTKTVTVTPNTYYLLTGNMLYLSTSTSATSGTITDDTEFLVSAGMIDATSLSISPSSVTLNINDTATVTAVPTPNTASPICTWSPNNSYISLDTSVGSSVVVTGVKQGVTQLTAMTGTPTQRTASVTVTVTNNVRYTISFNLNYTTSETFADVTGTRNGSYSTMNLTIPTTYVPSGRSYYTFAGWNTSPNGSGTMYTFSTPGTSNVVKMYRSIPSITLYAIWTPITYTVTLNAKGIGNPYQNATVSPDTVTARPDMSSTGIYVSYFPEPVNPGYVFNGWEDSSHNEYTSSTPITGNITLYAKYARGDSGATISVTRMIGGVPKTRIFHLDHIQSIDDTTSVNITSIPTIVYGADDRFLIDTGTSQKYNLEVARADPIGCTGYTMKEDAHSDDWGPTFDDRRFSNGLWMKKFRESIDFWQNFGLDDKTHIQSGGMKFRFIPCDNIKTIYPYVEKNVFISGGISAQYGVQKMTFNLPLQVARMKTSSAAVQTVDLVFYYDDESTEYQTYSFPANTTVPLPSAPSIWSTYSSNMFDHWVGDDDQVYMPGQLFYVNGGHGTYTFRGTWVKIVAALICERDSITPFPNQSTVNNYMSYTSTPTNGTGSATFNANLDTTRIGVYVVGGGGGAGGRINKTNERTAAPQQYAFSHWFTHYISGGGGGAGYTKSRHFNIGGNGMLSWTVGDGGNGGNAGSAGGDGGDSTISYNGGIPITAKGGAGGKPSMDNIDYGLSNTATFYTGQINSKGGVGGNVEFVGGDGGAVERIATTESGMSTSDYTITYGGNGSSGVTNEGNAGLGAVTKVYSVNKSGNQENDVTMYVYTGGAGGAAANFNISLTIGGASQSWYSEGGNGGYLNDAHNGDAVSDSGKTGTYGGGGGSSPITPGSGGDGIIVVLIYDTE